VRELDLVPARQEAVEDGWDLALEHKLTVDELDFLLGHLRSADAATFLGAVWGWAIVVVLFVVLFVFVQRHLGARQEGVSL
jgi:hypothetical protein